MPNIRPVSDLRNNFAEISHIVHNNHEEVYLTTNGYGDMVLMSVEQFDELNFEHRIHSALLASDAEMLQNPNSGIPFKEFANELRETLLNSVSSPLHENRSL